jgi:hypothetical protein
MIDRRIDRDKRSWYPEQHRHELGICGGNANLCYECAKDEDAFLAEWAKDKPAPIDGEDLCNYWRRIGGRYLDGWYKAAWNKQLKANGIADTPIK